MFAYCGNNPVNFKDTEGTLAGIIIGGVVGAITGALSAKASGQSVLFGAVIGGLAGMAAGTAGLFIATISNPVVAGGVGAIVNGLIGAGSNAFNQYVNYRLQDKARRENSGKGNTTTGQSQEDADKAYSAASFSAYFNLKDPHTSLNFAVSTGLSVGGGVVGGLLACGSSQAITSLSESTDLLLDAANSFGTSMMQIIFDPITKGEAGVN